MASRNNTESFKKATISFEENNILITEYGKDDTKVYDLKKVLRRWADIDGVTLTIKTEEDIEPDREG